MLQAGNALCAVFTLFYGGSPLLYSPSPRGNCENCCPFREPKDIRFLLYTRSNPEIADTLFLSDTIRIEKSNLNIHNKLVLYLHGFSEKAPGGKGQSSQEMRDAFLEAGDYNVILVDWSPLTTMPWYANSIENSPRVGRYIARFLKYLIDIGLPVENIHLVGFSLGAEVAGIAGKTLKEWGITLSRITGLDPAFPLYDLGDSSNRLNQDDAIFVDVIHTDGGVLGLPWPCGDADFFPNGGVPLQPGCAEQEISKNRWLTVIIGCSHQRAWQYFVESLKRPEAFLAEKCQFIKEAQPQVGECDKNITAYMGINANKKLRGKFYLETNNDSPYGMNLPVADAEENFTLTITSQNK